MVDSFGLNRPKEAETKDADHVLAEQRAEYVEEDETRQAAIKAKKATIKAERLSWWTLVASTCVPKIIVCVMISPIASMMVCVQ